MRLIYLTNKLAFLTTKRRYSILRKLQKHSVPEQKPVVPYAICVVWRTRIAREGRTSYFDHKRVPKGSQIWPQINQKAVQKRFRKRCAFGHRFWTHLGPIWAQFCIQKSSKNASEIDMHFSTMFSPFWDRFWSYLNSPATPESLCPKALRLVSPDY